MPEPLRQIIALFFLLFVLTDLTVVDVLFPERCGGDMFGLQDAAQAMSVSSTDDGVLPSHFESLSPTSDNQPSTLPATDDRCCFCCCTHVLLHAVPFIVSPVMKPQTYEIPVFSQPSSPPHSVFHPPRLV